MNQNESEIRRDEVAKCCGVKIDPVIDRLVRERPADVTTDAAREFAMKCVSAYRAAIRSDRFANIQ